MRPDKIWLIAKKEILSTLRDQRAIISNLLIPLLMLPLMMLGMPFLLGGLFQREAETVTEVGVLGQANVPQELLAMLEAQNVRLVPVDDPIAAVQADDVVAAITVPAGFAEALSAGGAGSIELATKVGNMRSELNSGKVQQAVAAYQQAVVAQRLSAAGLDPSVLTPVSVQVVDASSAAERAGGQLSWLIPFFIAIWTLTGGQMTAIDATAGEKERGTMEVLLVTPIRRAEAVMGKFLATLTFGLSAAFMAIVGYLLGGLLVRSVFMPRMGEQAEMMVQVMGGALSLSIGSLGLLTVSAVLLAAAVAALLLAIAMFARSFKEAQSYIAPLSFVFILPILFLQFRDLIGGGDLIYRIPVVNVLVLMDEAIKGNASTSAIATTWLSMLALVVVFLLFALRNFRRENVIFRT